MPHACTFLTFFYYDPVSQPWSLHLRKSTALSFVLSSILWFFFSSILCLFLRVVSLCDSGATGRRTAAPEPTLPPSRLPGSWQNANPRNAVRRARRFVHGRRGAHRYAEASEQRSGSAARTERSRSPGGAARPKADTRGARLGTAGPILRAPGFPLLRPSAAESRAWRFTFSPTDRESPSEMGLPPASAPRGNKQHATSGAAEVRNGSA